MCYYQNQPPKYKKDFILLTCTYSYRLQYIGQKCMFGIITIKHWMKYPKHQKFCGTQRISYTNCDHSNHLILKMAGKYIIDIIVNIDFVLHSFWTSRERPWTSRYRRIIAHLNKYQNSYMALRLFHKNIHDTFVRKKIWKSQSVLWRRLINISRCHPPPHYSTEVITMSDNYFCHPPSY